jgi:hypothetical protein
MLRSNETNERLAVNETGKRALLPSLGDFIFVFIFLILVRLIPSFMFGDGGTGWHLATGRFILENRRIPYEEFISYTFAGKPWITQYWLTDLAMYLVQLAAGYNGLAVLFAAVFAAIFLWLYHQCRQEGCTALISSFLVMVAVTASSVQFLTRPLVVSWAMVCVFALLLENIQKGKLTPKKAWIWFFLWSMLWSQCHSGYIFGIAQVIIYLGCNFLFAIFHSNTAERNLSRNRTLQLAGVLSCVLIGTSFNPYGIALHTNIMETLSNKAMIDSIQEFMSPSFHGGPQTGSLELLFALVIGSLYLTATSPSLPRLLTVIAFAHLALFSIRNAPIFAMIAPPFIAGCLAHTRLPEMFGSSDSSASSTSVDSNSPVDDSAAGAASAAKPPVLRRTIDAAISFEKKLSAQEVLNGYHLLPILLVVVFSAIALVGGSIGGNRIVQGGFSTNEFPTTTLTTVKRLGLNPKEGFNDANWGGYIFYEAGLPVYIDDRGTFFGDYYVRYGKIISLFPEWKELLKQDNINWIIFRKNTDLANSLLNDPDWIVLGEDPAAILFGRKGKVPQPAP